VPDLRHPYSVPRADQVPDFSVCIHVSVCVCVAPGPGGKLKEWVRLTEGVRISRAGLRCPCAYARVLGRASTQVEGPTVYIGDSVTDMLVLLRAQCGILIGGSRTFRWVSHEFGSVQPTKRHALLG
jgi:hypothetical protein